MLIFFMIKWILLITFLAFVCTSFAEGYDRKEFNYRSYKSGTEIGFYTGKICDFINIDHEKPIQIS